MRASRLCAALLSATLLTSGCYGGFTLTRGVHHWNGTVTHNKFVNTIIFWAMVIVPVYGLCTLGDALIFNVIEFWTNQNPLAFAPDENKAPPTVVALRDDLIVIEYAGKRYEVKNELDSRYSLTIDGVLSGTAMVTDAGALAFEHLGAGQTLELDAAELDALAKELPLPPLDATAE